MSNQKNSIFNEEEKILQSVKQFMHDHNEPIQYRSELENLVVHHESLLNEYRKIIQISDRLERNLFDTKNKLVEINHIRTHFINLIAHDLKNPVAVIQTLIRRFNQEDLSGENFYKKIAMIRSSLNQIMDIIDGISRESRFKNNDFKLQLYPVLPDIPAMEINERYKFLAEEKKIKVELNLSGSDRKVTIDSDIVKEIIDNLFSNAIKYSPLNSKVSLTVKADYEKSVLSYVIKDSGPGFTDLDKEKVFKIYGKLSAQPTNQEPSSGLGLVLVKHLTDMIKGTISLESNLNQGAVFTVQIPFSGEAQPENL